MTESLGKILRRKISERRALLVPGAANALGARIIADLEFEAIYVSGAGVTNTYFGVPDLGFISLPDIAGHTSAMRDAVELPLIVDADTGFGNALNVRSTVRTLERAGANAIQLEDQVMPKRCGRFASKDVIGIEEMTAKIRAAVDARSSEDFLIIARTDARAVHGFEAALDRAHALVEVGADVTFVEAPESIEEIREIAKRLTVPQLINMVVGGKTPVMDLADFADMRYGLVLYANASLQGAVLGMQRALTHLKNRGRIDEGVGLLADLKERQRLVQKPLFDRLDNTYAVK